MPFLSGDFLLQTEQSRELFSRVKGLPIVDYHCHLSPREIAENKNYSSLSELWLGGDHYKWRVMRLQGINEDLVSGKADGREKLRAFADALEHSPDCPVYYWTNMELSRYFGVDQPLTKTNADEIYDRCNELLQKPEFRPRSLLTRMNVRAICTTDSPQDYLEWHTAIKKSDFEVSVLPSFRPDGVLHPEKPVFLQNITQLAKSENVDIDGFAALKKALSNSLDRFCELGCVTSDHGFEGFGFIDCPDAEADKILKKALAGDALTECELIRYKSALMLYLGSEYRARGLVMQLHLGALRNASSRSYKLLGADAGFDSVGRPTDPFAIAALLDHLQQGDSLPKTIVYCLNPADYPVIATLCADFAAQDARNMVQLGAAWWFNDTERGIRDQLRFAAENGLLAGCPGMLTDSRSMTAFVRHEYYRRILCDYLGGLVESGRYHSLESAAEIAENISINNAVCYFNLKKN